MHFGIFKTVLLIKNKMLITAHNLDNCALRYFCGWPRQMVIVVGFAIASESTLKWIQAQDRITNVATSIAAAAAASTALANVLGSMVYSVAKSM